MTQPTYQTQEVTLDNRLYTIVQAYDLAAAVQAVQDHVQRGYEVCFNKNETYPISIGTMISFGVAKPFSLTAALAKPIVESDKPSVVPEQETASSRSLPLQQEAKPARKAKGTPLA
jgi:hypothetical protein